MRDFTHAFLSERIKDLSRFWSTVFKNTRAGRYDGASFGLKHFLKVENYTGVEDTRVEIRTSGGGRGLQEGSYPDLHHTCSMPSPCLKKMTEH